MKMVTAIIKPFKLDDVREALMKLGFEGMTVTEVRGCGRQKGKTENFQGNSEEALFLPKVKIELAVPAKKADKVIETIAEAANTGRIGDGKIFVHALDKIVRIRTGETGSDAV